MSESKHTPGTWTACEPFQDTFNKLISIKVGSAPAIEIARCYGPRKSQMADANARLIAAAPDLLAACKFFMSEIWDMTTEQFSHGADKPIREAMEKAIAKAEGL